MRLLSEIDRTLYQRQERGGKTAGKDDKEHARFRTLFRIVSDSIIYKQSFYYSVIKEQRRKDRSKHKADPPGYYYRKSFKYSNKSLRNVKYNNNKITSGTKPDLEKEGSVFGH